ncbi:hypothetical protein DER44DRAFT_791856 [Fusarium oxysporum]|nr:hypothetical protein DER44DRAFT_791856 [Fusarium oxysporum]
MWRRLKTILSVVMLNCLNFVCFALSAVPYPSTKFRSVEWVATPKSKQKPISSRDFNLSCVRLLGKLVGTTHSTPHATQSALTADPGRLINYP